MSHKPESDYDVVVEGSGAGGVGVALGEAALVAPRPMLKSSRIAGFFQQGPEPIDKGGRRCGPFWSSTLCAIWARLATPPVH